MYVVLTATSEDLLADLPSADVIEATIREVVSRTQHGAGTGDVIEGRVRVTRRVQGVNGLQVTGSAVAGALGFFAGGGPIGGGAAATAVYGALAFATTRVAALLKLDESLSQRPAAERVAALQALSDQTQHALDAAMNNAIDRWHVEILNYSPGQNGPVSWWGSGQAGNTRTRDCAVCDARSFALEAADNPIGPNIPIPTVTETLIKPTAEGVKTIGGSLLWVGAGAVGLYAVYKLVSALPSGAAASAATQDPSAPVPSMRLPARMVGEGLEYGNEPARVGGLPEYPAPRGRVGGYTGARGGLSAPSPLRSTPMSAALSVYGT